MVLHKGDHFTPYVVTLGVSLSGGRERGKERGRERGRIVMVGDIHPFLVQCFECFEFVSLFFPVPFVSAKQVEASDL